jgi:hypothetical protein
MDGMGGAFGVPSGTRRRMRWPGWFRRRADRPLTRPFDEHALPEATAPTLDHAVEEGMLLADYATRMAVKNHIVVDTIQEGHPFEPSRHAAQAAELLRELAAEQDAVAAHAAEVRVAVEGLGGDAQHPHDYRDVDVDNLALREDAAEALSTALLRKADSEPELLEIVDRARRDAWDEVASAITAGLDAFAGTEALKANYEAERPARLNLLIRRDLAKLEEERGGY